MELVARVLRFGRSSPGIFAPLLVYWVLQAVPAVLCARMSGPVCAMLDTVTGVVRLALPLAMAATAALILEGLENGSVRGRGLPRRTILLSLRTGMPWVILLLLGLSACRMAPLPGAAFFFGTMLLFTFLPEALSLETTFSGAVERSLCMLQEHPLSCFAASGAALLLVGLAYLAGLWHLEAGATDVHMVGLASPLMVPFVVVGVGLMVCRTLLYRQICRDEAVGIGSIW